MRSVYPFRHPTILNVDAHRSDLIPALISECYESTAPAGLRWSLLVVADLSVRRCSSLEQHRCCTSGPHSGTNSNNLPIIQALLRC